MDVVELTENKIHRTIKSDLHTQQSSDNFTDDLFRKGNWSLSRKDQLINKGEQVTHSLPCLLTAGGWINN